MIIGGTQSHVCNCNSNPFKEKGSRTAQALPGINAGRHILQKVWSIPVLHVCGKQSLLRTVQGMDGWPTSTQAEMVNRTWRRSITITGGSHDESSN